MTKFMLFVYGYCTDTGDIVPTWDIKVRELTRGSASFFNLMSVINNCDVLLFIVCSSSLLLWFKHIYFKVTMIIQTDMTYTQNIGLERKHKLI